MSLRVLYAFVASVVLPAIILSIYEAVFVYKYVMSDGVSWFALNLGANCFIFYTYNFFIGIPLYLFGKFFRLNYWWLSGLVGCVLYMALVSIFSPDQTLQEIPSVGIKAGYFILPVYGAMGAVSWLSAWIVWNKLKKEKSA